MWPCQAKGQGKRPTEIRRHQETARAEQRPKSLSARRAATEPDRPRLSELAGELQNSRMAKPPSRALTVMALPWMSMVTIPSRDQMVLVTAPARQQMMMPVPARPWPESAPNQRAGRARKASNA